MHFLSNLFIIPIVTIFVVISADSEVINDPFLPMSDGLSGLGQELTPGKDSLLASIFSGGIDNDCNYDEFLPINKVRARRSQCSSSQHVATPEQMTTPQLTADDRVVVSAHGVTTPQEMAEDGMIISKGGNIIDEASSDSFNTGSDDNENRELSSAMNAPCPAHAMLTADNKSVREEDLKCMNPYKPDMDLLYSIPLLPPDDHEGICDRFLPEKRWPVCDSGNRKDKFGRGFTVITLKNSLRVFMIFEG